MNRTKENILIAKYLLKYLQGNCSQSEKATVDDWLETPSNKEFFGKLKVSSASDIITKQSIDLSIARAAIEKEFKAKRKVKIRRYLLMSAASILIFFTISGLYIFNNYKNTNSISKIATIEDITPGRNKAILKTSKGEKFLLDGDIPLKSIKEKDGTTITLKGDSLIYKTNSKSSAKIAYNTIEVPRNGEFSFLMSDGTKVWLNSDTKLRYPVSFKGKERKVYLEGEAFFDVTKNKSMPFIVRTGNSFVKVLGTQFNVRNYKNENKVTTLVEGKVEINDSRNNKKVIIPGQQATIKENEIEVKKVETIYYTGWKDGYFIYEDAKLDYVLRQLSRWYDFEYFYQNKDLANKTFTARLKKYEGVNKIFKILEQTGKVKFRQKGKSVIILDNK